MSSITISLLERARELILPRGAWIKDDFYGVRKGNYYDPAMPGEATCFCLIGAVNRAAVEMKLVRPIESSFTMRENVHITEATNWLAKAIGNYQSAMPTQEVNVITWNDNQTRKSTVVKAIDKAIELKKKEVANG